jgi:excisionase family DNA binding protein
MKRDDLPTVGYLDECFRIMLAHIAAISKGPVTIDTVGAELLTIEDVMERLRVSRSTVQRWVKTGKIIKVGSKRQQLKLPTLWFTPSEPRIPWPALLAFGRGESYDLGQLPAPPLPKSTQGLGQQASMRMAS